MTETKAVAPLDELLSDLMNNFEQTCKETPLASLIDLAFEHKMMRVKQQEALLSELKTKQAMLETAIQAVMEASGTEEQPLLMAGGLSAAAILTDVATLEVEDWDAFGEYVHENSAQYLLQRRVSSTALAAEMTTNTVPGVRTNTFKKLTLRKR